MSNSAPLGVTHLVIGGSGFLGSNIVNALVKRGEDKVHSTDLRQPQSNFAVAGVPFHAADITSQDALNKLFAELKPDVVYHTASPLATGSRNAALYEKVNVTGTANVVAACQRSNVRALVFTSSASVVSDGTDLINVDERMPYPKVPFDAYSETKARAEQLVLESNTEDGTSGLKTIALRPAGIFGPNDRQMIPQTINVLKTGRQNVQLGNNDNLQDFTYVENLVHAHLLAADRLLSGARPYSRDLLASVHLPIRHVGTAEPESILDRGVPTSENRPDVLGAPDYARTLPSNRSDDTHVDGVSTIDLRPVIRNKFDQFFHVVNPDIACASNPIPETVSIAEEHVSVAGEAFFITNGEPVPIWDIIRAIWKEYDGTVVDPKKVWHLSKDTAKLLAYFAEWSYWLKGRPGSFDRYKVGVATMKRFYNIEKARRALGYEPLYSLEEGIKRSVAWYKQAELRGEFSEK